jgi:hypothetical protein
MYCTYTNFCDRTKRFGLIKIPPVFNMKGPKMPFASLVLACNETSEIKMQFKGIKVHCPAI